MMYIESVFIFFFIICWKRREGGLLDKNVRFFFLLKENFKIYVFLWEIFSTSPYNIQPKAYGYRFNTTAIVGVVRTVYATYGILRGSQRKWILVEY